MTVDVISFHSKLLAMKVEIKRFRSKHRKTNYDNMTRQESIKKLGRYILLMLMTLIVLLLGNRVVTGSACNSCPGKGVCNGETDCNKY
jgi:hypothetical protein